MDVLMFCSKVMSVCLMHQGSVISWGRSAPHNKGIGGSPSSLHLAFLAVDIVFEKASAKESAKVTCNRLDLFWVEKAYQTLHVQALALPGEMWDENKSLHDNTL